MTVVELPFQAFVRGGVGSHVRHAPRVTKTWLSQNTRRVDGMHFHSVFQPESWFLARSVDRPYCVSPHGGYTMFRRRHRMRSVLKRPLWYALERPMLKRASFIHAISQNDAASVESLVAGLDIALISHGAMSAPVALKPTPQDGPWLYIGRLDVDQKGLDALIEGYAGAAERDNVPRLIMRGPDFRGGRARIAQLIDRFGLGDVVEIGGPVVDQDKWRLLDSASLFLHPSRNEGMPGAVVEALASGRPVAVTPEVNLGSVGAFGIGFDIAETTPGAIGDTLSEAARAGNDLVAMGLRAKEFATERYSWNVAARRLADQYRRHFMQS
jgi:glycosyltransferase involved in cell wall biosynthesis